MTRGGDKDAHTFLERIYPKVGVITQLESEHTNFRTLVQLFSHYAMGKFFMLSLWVFVFVDAD